MFLLLTRYHYWSDNIKRFCSNQFIWWVVWNIFHFSIYWECHHPNWLTPSFFRGVGLNHQPVIHLRNGDFPMNKWWFPMIFHGFLYVYQRVENSQGAWPRIPGARLSRCPSTSTPWPGPRCWTPSGPRCATRTARRRENAPSIPSCLGRIGMLGNLSPYVTILI